MIIARFMLIVMLMKLTLLLVTLAATTMKVLPLNKTEQLKGS